jgi:hypothetical protein
VKKSATRVIVSEAKDRSVLFSENAAMFVAAAIPQHDIVEFFHTF